MSLKQKAEKTSLSPSAKVETTIPPLPGAEEPPVTPNPSTKSKARPNPVKIRPQDTGLKIMFEPPILDDIEYDVVAVHGIAAYPPTAWEHRVTKVNWLSDPTMLPSSLPRARIMTYGYHSYWFGDDARRISIESVATEFLQDLEMKRSKCQDRPLLLVGHCFGGLVMQKVSLHTGGFAPGRPSWNTRFNNRHGIPGYPHKGVSNGSKHFTMSEVYKAILAAEVHTQDNVLHSMSQDNDVLQETVHNFTRAVGNLQARAPKLFCFYESKATNTGLVAGLKKHPLEFVATESSATLSGHEKRSLALNHFELNKFEDREDHGYQMVEYQIVKMAEASHDIIRRREQDCGLTPDEITDKAPANAMVSNFTNRNHLPSPCGAHREGRAFCAKGRGVEGAGGQIAEKLHLSRAEVKTSGVLAAVRDALRQDVSGQWLMVLDGLEDLELRESSGLDSGNLLQEYVPKSSHRAQILVTTRSRTIASHLARGSAHSIITVPQLSDKDASFLLLGQSTSNKNTLESSISTAKKLGGSAGTLTLAHLYRKKTRVSKTSFSWKEYLDKMCLENAPPQRKPNTYAAELLLLVASLDVGTISSAFFDRNELSVLSKRLVDYGMIEPSADRRLVNLTPVIRRCVRTWLRENDKQDSQEAKTLSAVVYRFDETDADTSSHILPCALAAIKFQPTTTKGKSDLAALLWKVAIYYKDHGQNKVAHGHLERCLKLREGHSHIDEDVIQETKRMMEEIKGWTQVTSRESTKGTKNVINVSPASIAEEQLRVLEEIQGGDHVGTIRKASDFAKLVMMHGNKGTSSQAISQYQRVLDWCIKHRGPDHLDTARQQHNLALAYEDSGDHGRATQLYLQAAQTTEQSLGPENAEQHRILANMACMYAEQGRVGEAQEAFELALRGQRRVLGFDHPDTLVTRQNMAILLGDAGQLDTAGTWLQEILVLQDRLLGQHDRNTLSTACSLAQNFGLRKRYEDSATLFKSTWEIQREVLGETYRDTLKTRAMLDQLMQAKGKSKN
ncbi:uncharacterized protein PG998_004430 [Apiospora kogelbergensis]|uniref:uncharacterized protein n=1 Tax=Apiospora kogelbergensis TaxID=1337665 RepID=UPI00312D4693